MSHYTLYGRRNAGSLAPQIVLEETGAPYELIWVGRSGAEIESLRRINPAGKVPALVLPDGTAIAESAAILIHLTEAHPQPALAPPAGTSEHARFLQWMVFLSSSLYETVLRYYYPERYTALGESGAAAVKDQALLDLDRHLGRVEGVLSPYLLGKSPSAADVYLHMLASWYPGEIAAQRSRLPRLARLSDLLRERPAVRKAEAAHAEV